MTVPRHASVNRIRYLELEIDKLEISVHSCCPNNFLNLPQLYCNFFIIIIIFSLFLASTYTSRPIAQRYLQRTNNGFLPITLSHQQLPKN